MERRDSTISPRIKYSPEGRDLGRTKECFPVVFLVSLGQLGIPLLLPSLELTTSLAHCWLEALNKPDSYTFVQTVPCPSNAAAVEGALAT